MSFKFEPWMVHHYHQDGYMIFRSIIPPTLLQDLRKEADKARDLAHRLNGPQTQRIQPLNKYGEDINLRPFQDYVELDVLRHAVTELLGPGYTHAHLDIMGLLVEPQDNPWHCGWHRDGVVEVPIEARDEAVKSYLSKIWYDMRFYNQVNCAIYADACTWYVPGSHLRQEDMPGETQSTSDQSVRQLPDTWSHAEREQFLFEHCRSFPDAVQVQLHPGDFMIYRNLAWHCGMYLTYQPRATIHDIISHEDLGSFRDEWGQVKSDAIKRMKAK